MRKLALAAALAAAALAALLVLEAGLRVAKLGAPVWHHPDGALGWTLRPYAHDASVRINAAGRRDAPHPVDKRRGVFRIALLGDEYSEAIGLPLRSTWWWQLPRELDRCGFQPGRQIEVLNFGVAGYSTAQQAIVLETAVLRYRPDLVLVQLTQGDDVRENSFALAQRRDRPFFRIDPDTGALRLDESFVNLRDFERRSQFRWEVARELSDRSRLLQLLSRIPAFRSAHADPAGVLASLEAPRDPRWEDAWRVTEALLERMALHAGRNGARLAVVAVPHPLELERSLPYAEARLARFGASHGIALIPLERELRAALYSPQGGWTLAGHRRAAEAVAAALCAG